MIVSEGTTVVAAAAAANMKFERAFQLKKLHFHYHHHHHHCRRNWSLAAMILPNA